MTRAESAGRSSRSTSGAGVQRVVETGHEQCDAPRSYTRTAVPPKTSADSPAERSARHALLAARTSGKLAARLDTGQPEPNSSRLGPKSVSSRLPVGPNVYLREDRFAPKVNAWIAELFDVEHIDETIAALAQASDQDGQARTAAASTQRRLREADATMIRLQRALDAGWEPDALKDQFNAAAAEKRAAEAELAGVSATRQLTPTDIRDLITQVGDVHRIIAKAQKADLAQLYQDLGLSIDYDHTERTAAVTIKPATRTGGTKVGVRGGT